MWKEKNSQEILREDVLIGCVCKPWEWARRGAGQRGRGARRTQEARLQRWKVDQKSAEPRRGVRKAAVPDRVAAKQRARRGSLRKFCWVGKKEVPDDLGENRFSGLEARLQGVKE